MNKEAAFMNPAWHVPDERAEEKVEAKAEAEPRLDLLKAAIGRTILGVLQENNRLEAMKKISESIPKDEPELLKKQELLEGNQMETIKKMSKNLSNYELSLLEKYKLSLSEERRLLSLGEKEPALLEKKNRPDIRALFDIDGVLIDTDSAFIDIAKTLRQDLHIAKNIKTAAGLVGKDMSFGVKRELLKCKEFVQEMTLVTDRYGAGTRFFPCFNDDDQKVFEDHGINVKTNTFKFLPTFSRKENFLSQIKEADITLYFGSSNSDKEHFDQLQKIMQKEGVPAKKLVYVNAGKEGAFL